MESNSIRQEPHKRQNVPGKAVSVMMMSRHQSMIRERSEGTVTCFWHDLQIQRRPWTGGRGAHVNTDFEGEFRRSDDGGQHRDRDRQCDRLQTTQPARGQGLPDRHRLNAPAPERHHLQVRLVKIETERNAGATSPSARCYNIHTSHNEKQLVSIHQYQFLFFLFEQ